MVRPRGEGDSRFAVFGRATDGVAAASAMQVALVDEAWPAELALRVRIALHTGEADFRSGDYYGPAVNHCARLRAVAHGTQVLVSSVTADLVRESLAADISLRDLGEHLLKDLERPEHVWQLVHPSLPTEFPPLDCVWSGLQNRAFAEYLRRYRLMAGLTQEGLADKTGLSVRGISDLERGLRNAPHPDTVRRLADALGLHAEERASFIRLAIVSSGGSTASVNRLNSAPAADLAGESVTRADRLGSSSTSADSPRSFGVLLRQQRMAAGLTQDELAQRSGLSRRGIADLERGARNFPRGDTFRRIAEALSLPPMESAALQVAGQRTERSDLVKRYTLPVEPSPLVGREQELSELQLVLKSGPLATLTGPGGIGKTRLALEVARRAEADYDNGAVYIDLASVTDPALVPQAAALAIGVREERNKPLIETVQDHLSARQVLVVLDNCEHLLDGSARLADALAHHCPEVRILATSREPMRIKTERVWVVPPLRMDEACQLFVERARAAQSTLQLTPDDADVIADICHHLDGIPLAIELAAARVPALALPQIAARLSERLHLLSRGGRLDSPRHKTLRAAIDWSYTLLSEPERYLFEQLAVFAGGWELTAAEHVCDSATLASADVLAVLASLVDKSLVVAERSTARMRYRLLETIREYAMERLHTSGEASKSLARRHADFFLTLAERDGRHVWGAEQAAGLERFEREHDNFRAALRFLTQRGNHEDALRLATALTPFWVARGHFSEAQQWLDWTLHDCAYAANRGHTRWRVVRGRGCCTPTG